MAKFRSKPASQTDEGRERFGAYWLALGEFAHIFSRVEMFMHFVLRWHTKTSVDIARAVFSGVRIDAASQFLGRLATNGNITPEEWAELKPVLDQLGLIGKRRNNIFHYGAEAIAEGRGFVTNALMAITEDRIQSFPISPEVLRDMTIDLRKILVHLRIRHVGRPAPRGDHPAIDAILRAAWRYKPPPQSQNRSRQDDKIPKPKRQRSPSPN